jgi:hypothetical protein
LSNPSPEYLYQEDLYHIPGSVIVIVSRPWHKILEDERALLAKILGSVRVGMGSVTIQSMPTVKIESLKAFGPQKVLIFGASVEGEIKPYERTVLEGVSVIKADDFNQLDEVKKKNLWIALKQMFGL